MTLGHGLHPVSGGDLATVVTYLEMTAAPALRPAPPPDDLALIRVAGAEPAWYRDLFRRIGAAWLWSSRLVLSENELAAILSDSGTEIWTLRRNGRDEALLELSFRVPGECELAFLGLTPALRGRGIGRFLIAHALAAAWARPIGRLWLHTCSHDHPSALPFYLGAGFRPYRCAVEVLPDPRLAGVIATDAAPQVPIIPMAMDGRGEER